MQPVTKELRKVVANIKGSWIRVFKCDDEIWAGYDVFKGRESKENGTKLVKEALEKAGYKCEMRGIKGTSGEFIINVEKV